MLAACLALAVLIAFSLQRLVPQHTSATGSQSAQNEPAPARTEVTGQTEVTSATAVQTAAGNRSGADVGLEAENQINETTGNPQDGAVSESAGDSANNVATAVSSDTNSEANTGSQSAQAGDPAADQQPSDTATQSQPSGSVLVDSVSNVSVATRDQMTDAGQSSIDVEKDASAKATSTTNADVDKNSDSDAANPREQAEPSVGDSTVGLNDTQKEEVTETVTLERIPRSSAGNADGPVDVTTEGAIDEEPLSLGLNANAGKVIVSGKLPRSRFASVLLQVLRGATDKPLDARKLKLIAGDTRDTPWVFDIAKAMGSVDLEFTTLDLQSDGESITVVGDVSTITEKQELLAIFESEDTSLELHPDSQILVVPVQQPQLSVSYEDGEYKISGVLANAQRELYERSVGTRTSGDGELRWRRKVGQLEIVDSLSVILDIMQKSLQSGELRVAQDSMELEGIVMSDPEVNLALEQQKAARRNVVAVFSSVLPETESVRIDIRLNDIRLDSGEPAEVTDSAQPVSAPQLLAEESQTEAATQANDEASEAPETEALQTEAAENDSSQASTEVAEVVAPATATVGSNESVVEDSVGTTNRATNRVTELLAADAGIDSGLQNELAGTITDLQTRFEQFKYTQGQSELSDENREILDQLFEVLFLFPSLKATMGVDVADQNRSVENLSLSRQRADGIRDYVIGLGVEPYRLTVAGYGDSRKATTQSAVESEVTLDFSSIP